MSNKLHKRLLILKYKYINYKEKFPKTNQINKENYLSFPNIKT